MRAGHMQGKGDSAKQLGSEYLTGVVVVGRSQVGMGLGMGFCTLNLYSGLWTSVCEQECMGS